MSPLSNRLGEELFDLLVKRSVLCRCDVLKLFPHDLSHTDGDLCSLFAHGNSLSSTGRNRNENI